METDKLIELLMKEREYHSSHPTELYKKFVYSLGASLAAVTSSIYLTNGFVNIRLANIHYSCLFIFVLGVLVILVGLLEHSNLHSQQREKIELAINELLNKGTEFNNKDFWDNYGSHSLNYITFRKLLHKTPLITLEPDKRSFWGFHDRKFDLGVMLIATTYFILICQAIS